MKENITMTDKTEKKEPVYADVHEVLHFIQKSLKAPKGQENKFGGYKYRSCEDIVEAVKLILPPGVTLLIRDDIVQVGDRFYIKASVDLCFKGSCVSTQSFARESLAKKGMDEAQITGATSSYARKYALNGLFMIDDTKDADATNDHGKGEPKPEPDPKPKPEPVKPLIKKDSPQRTKIVDWKKKLDAMKDYDVVMDFSRAIAKDMGDFSIEQVKFVNDMVNAKLDTFTRNLSTPLDAG
jgi:hypothetical protein